MKIEDKKFLAWRDIRNCDGYDISNDGYIRSWFGPNGYTRKEPRIMKPTPNGDGYLSSRANRHNKEIRIHIAVIEAFKGLKPTPQHQCRHLDGNKLNNHISNLKWGTAKENAQDRENHGRTVKGIKHPSAKLTELDVISIMTLFVYKGESMRFIAKSYGVSHTTISKLLKRKTWKHIA